MSLENEVASYEINIKRTGDGAVQATKELQALNQAAKEVSTGAHNASGALETLHHSSLLGRDSLHAFNGIALLTGSQHLPILREAVMSTHGAMNLLRNSSAAWGVSVGAMAIGFGAVGAAVGAGLLIWNHYRDELKKTEEQAKSMGTALAAVPALIKTISELQRAGAITPSQA